MMSGSATAVRMRMKVLVLVIRSLYCAVSYSRAAGPTPMT